MTNLSHDEYRVPRFALLVCEQIASGLTAGRCVHIRWANFNNGRLPQGFNDTRLPLQMKWIELGAAERDLVARRKTLSEPGGLRRRIRKRAHTEADLSFHL
ncbi:hypothetical protein [Paraburkholderia sp. RL17-337-BIB-A]|uniref:hypothetical protein n=1 Tax=Paraburkholderia sp. RL17-337-BIB-A TaxID=3031636 RepID=UPI0038B88A44